MAKSSGSTLVQSALGGSTGQVAIGVMQPSASKSSRASPFATKGFIGLSVVEARRGKMTFDNTCLVLVDSADSKQRQHMSTGQNDLLQDVNR